MDQSDTQKDGEKCEGAREVHETEHSLQIKESKKARGKKPAENRGLTATIAMTILVVVVTLFLPASEALGHKQAPGENGPMRPAPGQSRLEEGDPPPSPAQRPGPANAEAPSSHDNEYLHICDDGLMDFTVLLVAPDSPDIRRVPVSVYGAQSKDECINTMMTWVKNSFRGPGEQVTK